MRRSRFDKMFTNLAEKYCNEADTVQDILTRDALAEEQQNLALNTFFGCAVIASGLLVGIEVNHVRGREVTFFFLELIFTALFLGEHVFRVQRLARKGRQYILRDLFGWLDRALVGLSFVDLVMSSMELLNRDPEETDGYRFSYRVRMLRRMRLLRLGRTMDLFRELKLIVVGIRTAVRSMGWMMCLISMVLFASAVFATATMGHNWGGNYEIPVPGTDEVVTDFFANVQLSMYTLFYCIGEGCSEKVVIPVLREVPNMAIFFVPFLCLTTYCFLNVIIGVFVECTLSISNTDHQKVLANRVKQRRLSLEYARVIFEKVDKMGIGYVSKETFLSVLRTDHDVQEALVRLGLADIQELFGRLDVDGSGTMDLGEFIDGIFTLKKGEAQATRGDVGSVYSRLVKLQEDTTDHVIKEAELTRTLVQTTAEIGENCWRDFGELTAQLQKLRVAVGLPSKHASETRSGGGARSNEPVSAASGGGGAGGGCGGGGAAETGGTEMGSGSAAQLQQGSPTQPQRPVSQKSPGGAEDVLEALRGLEGKLNMLLQEPQESGSGRGKNGRLPDAPSIGMPRAVLPWG